MRETFTSIQTQAQQYVGITASDTTVNNILKKNINLSYRFMQSKFDRYPMIKTITTTSTAGQLYYHNPPGFVNIEDVYVTINSVKYPLFPLNNQMDWDYKTAISFTGTAFPKYFFQRQNDFGIWPTLQSAYTITLNYYYRSPDFANDDYTTGTLTVTQDSTAVVGSGTAWTSAMVGRWLQVTTDGSWYRIQDVGSTTTLTLESYYEGSSGSSLAYTIGESPELPEEAHELVAYRAASMYLGGVRNDATRGQALDNYFWTGDFTNPSRKQNVAGGFIALVKKYSSRSNSAVVRPIKRRSDVIINSMLFGTTVS